MDPYTGAAFPMSALLGDTAATGAVTLVVCFGLLSEDVDRTTARLFVAGDDFDLRRHPCHADLACVLVWPCDGAAFFRPDA